MDKSRVSRESFENEAGDRRKSGKAKTGVYEDVENDVRELNVKIWRQKTVTEESGRVL
jgi:hypothetical protein